MMCVNRCNRRHIVDRGITQGKISGHRVGPLSGSRVSGAIAKQSLLFSIPLPFLDGLALVVLFLPFGEPDCQLDAAVLVMKVEWSQRVSRTLHFADQTIDLIPMQK